jgi:hypothetical protein
MNQIPCCPKCGESPSTYYKGIRGDEGDSCDISDLVEGEDCVCYECIEQIVWRSIGLPKRPRTVLCRSGIEIVTEDVPGSPYQIGQRVLIANAGTDESFDTSLSGRVGSVTGFVYDCGATSPCDPLIKVAGVSRTSGHWSCSFWGEELSPYKESADEASAINNL